jgi:hypothetical protein
MEIDTTNQFGVCASGNGSIGILVPPRGMLTKQQALTLAAWLVALADPLGEEFQNILEAVQNT